MMEDPRAWLPRHKCDSEHTRRIIALGYPAVSPVLPELLEWLQDGNWPIARRIGRFLASVGEPVVPLVRQVFAGTDGGWKYWCIELFVRELPREIAEQLRPELQRFAFHPTVDDHLEELDDRAREALNWLNAE